jgi:putative transposase
VEPACAVLEIPPSTYYAAKKREENPSARDERDEELKREIMRVREKKGRKLYGAKKMWRELNRDGIEVARCTVERLMREMGLEGLRARKKRPRTTVPGPAGQERPSDLLERDFTAEAPNRRWVADITYIDTSSGFVYAAFILDLFSRMIEGYSGGGAKIVANFRLAARLRERRPASRKDWVTTLSPVETGRVCIIPPDSAKTRSSTCAR